MLIGRAVVIYFDDFKFGDVLIFGFCTSLQSYHISHENKRKDA